LKYYFWLLNHNNKEKMNVPENLHYTEEHEWVKIEGDEAIIGVTDFAQGELGDVVYVEVETLGDTLEKGEVFGTVEAVKTVSDLYMPLSGEVVAMNEELEAAPETINQDPYGKGWMVKVKMSNPDEVGALLSAADYKALIA
jgi:glycine cleavage system H protein